ncbi:MAG: Fic family protein [Verrucomicrobiales bacterium]|jgi:Fic family protein|nr:Fic family protein [Verrucomicrobiales bacterium]
MPVQYHQGKFPPPSLDWDKLIPLIGPANAGLARYEGLLSAIPNAHVLLAPMTTQEAVLSSKIEDTHVTMSEVLEVEAGGQPELFSQAKRDDVEEVLNYRKAMQACAGELKQRPFSQQILRSAHALLMRGVRGQDKTPGQYRADQNWIGPRGCSIQAASFMPIDLAHLQSGMDLWEKYFGSEKEPDKLIQLAVLHVEFEALHPFQDGNGRLGRMLLPLFLLQHKLLSSPDFYMSGYLEANREEYQERLRAVSRDNDWTGWCAFFLQGIIQQAEENERKARTILSLYHRLKAESPDFTHSQHAIRAVDFIFKTPIFSASHFTNPKHSGIPKPTATRILNLMRGKQILATVREGRGRQSGIYAFKELLNIAEGKEFIL